VAVCGTSKKCSGNHNIGPYFESKIHPTHYISVAYKVFGQLFSIADIQDHYKPQIIQQPD
jgi:hypothetical protein